MSVLQHSLLVLPIHRFSYSEYYARHDRFVAKQKAILEGQRRRKFESLDRSDRMAWEMDWFWEGMRRDQSRPGSTAFPDGARNASARFYRPPCSHYGRGVA